MSAILTVLVPTAAGPVPADLHLATDGAYRWFTYRWRAGGADISVSGADPYIVTRALIDTYGVVDEDGIWDALFAAAGPAGGE